MQANAVKREEPMDIDVCDVPIPKGMDLNLMKQVGETLFKHYPGYQWGVIVQNGVIDVLNMNLSGKWGFRLLTKDLDPDMKVIMRAGGEILERYKLKRGAFNEDTYNNLKFTPTGLLVAEH